MFVRSELKTLAKKTLSKNFIIPFLVCLLSALISGNLFSVNYNFNASSTTIEVFDAFQFEVFLPILGIFIAFSMIGSFIYTIFITNPFDVGVARFFARNTEEQAEFEDLIHGFKTNYLNVVKVTLICSLKILLYFLMFIIPGIIKSIQYTFVPYLINDYPEATFDEIEEMSIQMTEGRKFDIFIYNLSFILWDLAVAFLAPFTLGLCNIALTTYKRQTTAYLYQWAKENTFETNHSEEETEIITESLEEVLAEHAESIETPESKAEVIQNEDLS